MSSIPYRAIPISLETHPEWLKLSLKRRELFLFLMRKAVSVESFQFKGEILTYGQYVWSLNRLREKFNETLNPEDQYSRSGLQEALQHLYKINFIDKAKFGTSVHAETIVTITYSDSCELIKNRLRTAFDDLRTTSVQPQESFTVQPGDSKNQPHNTSTMGNNENVKTSSVQPEISLNNGAPYTQQDLTRSNTKDSVLEDNVQTVPLSKNKYDNVRDDVLNAAKKYKLTQMQVEILAWLFSLGIDSSKQTLSFWAKSYSKKRLEEVYKAALQAKPKKDGSKSIGALMNHFLKKDIPVDSDFKSENIAFMDGFKDRNPSLIWNIGTKFVTCKIKGIKKEVNLNIHPHSFVDQLIMLENLFKESRT